MFPHRRLERCSNNKLHIALLVVSCVKHLLSTHGANTFLVSTGEAILALLVELLFAYCTFDCTIRCPSVLLRQKFILIDLTPSTFGCIACALFPFVRNNHLC